MNSSTLITMAIGTVSVSRYYCTSWTHIVNINVYVRLYPPLWKMSGWVEVKRSLTGALPRTYFWTLFFWNQHLPPPPPPPSKMQASCLFWCMFELEQNDKIGGILYWKCIYRSVYKYYHKQLLMWFNEFRKLRMHILGAALVTYFYEFLQEMQKFMSTSTHQQIDQLQPIWVNYWKHFQRPDFKLFWCTHTITLRINGNTSKVFMLKTKYNNQFWTHGSLLTDSN